AVLVAQRIAVARLGAKVLHRQNADARDALVLLASDRKRAAPLLLGIAEGGDPDMDFTRAVRLVPVLRVIDSFVAKLPGARGHPDAERLRKALQRLLRKPERFKARIADSDRQPGLGRIPPIRGGG